MSITYHDYQKLIDSGLVKRSIDTEKGLVTLKYSRKVFYKKLWNEHPLLLQARGHVFDGDTGDLVVRPFYKVFNYTENGAGENLKDEDEIILVDKVNGFMASLTIMEDGGALVSTTGSTSSYYAVLAEKVLKESGTIDALKNGYRHDLKMTFMFEICDPSDPHIVEENYGAHLIGIVYHNTGDIMPHQMLEQNSKRLALFGSKHHWPEYVECSFGEAKDMLADYNKEGFMVVSRETGQFICKMKSPHYLTKKFLMRMNANRGESMYSDKGLFKKTIDEEFYDLVDFLTGSVYSSLHKVGFHKLSEQERRSVIENYFGGYYEQFE